MTSDQEVAAAAREVRARVLSSQEFARQLSDVRSPGTSGPETDPDLSVRPDEVDEWLELFKGNKGDTP